MKESHLQTQLFSVHRYISGVFRPFHQLSALFQRKRRLKQDSTKTGVPIAPGALRESGLCALGAMSGSPDKVGDMGEGCLKNMEN